MQNINFPSVRGIGQAGNSMSASMPTSNQQGRGPMSRYTGPDARPAGGRRDGQNRLRTMLGSMRRPNQNALANASPNAAFNRAGGLPGFGQVRPVQGALPRPQNPGFAPQDQGQVISNASRQFVGNNQPIGGQPPVYNFGPSPQPTGGQGALRQLIGGQQSGARPVPGQNVIPNPGGMRQMVPSSNLGPQAPMAFPGQGGVFPGQASGGVFPGGRPPQTGGPGPTPYPGSGIGQPGGGIMALRSMGGRMPMENQGY